MPPGKFQKNIDKLHSHKKQEPYFFLNIIILLINYVNIDLVVLHVDNN